ncbi:MAG: hypothetical protein KDK71_09555 [Chlamydiia bacterium]|nr:hypothetical protein [Chlamydiia bacterium]
MKIKVTEKYRPFSHEVGTPLLLPESAWKVAPFPARLVLEHLITKEKIELFPQIKGPITAFTAMQDLEKKRVRIFGTGEGGFFSYRLYATPQEIILQIERCSEDGLSFNICGEIKTFTRKETFSLHSNAPFQLSHTSEKMHLGTSKKQDWTLVKRRLLLSELLPILFELGKNLPNLPSTFSGAAEHLKTCQELVANKDRVHIGPSFIELFKRGFEGILCPRLIDTDYQGIANPEEMPENASPLFLIKEGACLIRSLLIEEKDNSLTILPCLPKELHAGRFVNIACTLPLTLDLEWSKKQIRRLALHPKEDLTLHLIFPKENVTYRLRAGPRGRGETRPATGPLTLKKGKLYLLDRFQK